MQSYLGTTGYPAAAIFFNMAAARGSWYSTLQHGGVCAYPPHGRAAVHRPTRHYIADILNLPHDGNYFNQKIVVTLCTLSPVAAIYLVLLL